MKNQYQYDVLIIGAGAAGLTLALRLADRARVAVLAKGMITEGSTLHAQGGIAAVSDMEDSLDDHVKDTVSTGAGLCDIDAVKFTVGHAQEAVQWLVGEGVKFTRTKAADGTSSFHLTREGGHSCRRVLHAADATGKEIETTLERQARAHTNISLFPDRIAIDLITTNKLKLPGNRCLGAYVLDRRQQQVGVFRARFVVLATGGASKVYLYTTNPDIATGDGIAMAWRAGCRVANMEFIQFHPTCLYHPRAKSFLITEAVRGGNNRNGFFGYIKTKFKATLVNVRKVANNEFSRLMADVQQNMIGAEALHFMINGARHDIAWCQFAARIKFMHEWCEIRQQQFATFAAHSLSN